MVGFLITPEELAAICGLPYIPIAIESTGNFF
ncbi:MAG: hypothetical protein LEGION0403_FIIPPAGN_02747 [Legionella sp.]